MSARLGLDPPFRYTPALAAITCALAPAYTVRWHVGFYPTTLLENFILLTVLVFAIETWRGRHPVVWRTPFFLPAALFLIAGAIGVLVAADHRAGLGLYRAYLIEPMLFFVVLINVVRTFDRALLVLSGLAVAVLVVALSNAFVVMAAGLSHSLDLAGTPPVVIYQTANAVALFLLPVMAVAASLALFSRGPARAASLAFLVITIPAFVLSFSRGGYLALAGVALALALSHRYRAWLVAGTLAAVLLLSRVPIIATRLVHQFNLGDPSNTFVGRLELWRTTLQMLRDHPVFGVGVAGFADGIAPYWNPRHTDRFIYPHNMLLNFWVETGVLGVIAFGWLMIQAFRVTWRGWRENTEWSPLHLGVLLALVGVVIHGLVDVPYWKNDLSFEFWTLLALSWAGIRFGKRKTLPAGR